MQTKTIKLYPTLFELDFYLSDNREDLIQPFIEKYGMDQSYWEQELSPNASYIIDCDLGARLVITMSKMDIAVLVHEVSHILDKLSKLTGLELGKESSEWKAYFMEYVVRELIN